MVQVPASDVPSVDGDPGPQSSNPSSCRALKTTKTRWFNSSQASRVPDVPWSAQRSLSCCKGFLAGGMSAHSAAAVRFPPEREAGNGQYSAQLLGTAQALSLACSHLLRFDPPWKRSTPPHSSLLGIQSLLGYHQCQGAHHFVVQLMGVESSLQRLKLTSLFSLKDLRSKG